MKHEEAIETLNWAITCANKLEKIVAAIHEYHYALDYRKHGGVAQDVAFNRICDVLNMHYSPKSIRANAK
jgi:hypothetical protein